MKNTELTFSCIDKITGNWYELQVDNCKNEYPLGITYGKNLTGEEYYNDMIDICLDVDNCKEYFKDKIDSIEIDVIEDILEVISKYK